MSPLIEGVKISRETEEALIKYGFAFRDAGVLTLTDFGDQFVQDWCRQRAIDHIADLGLNARVHNADVFHAVPERAQSPEWDFGVMWTEHGTQTAGYSAWPLWRVSWIIDTGELYAQTGCKVRVLGVVPRVGEYPYGNHQMWLDFKNQQTIEKVMRGWADGEPHKPLSWITDRLATLSQNPV